MAPLAVLVRQPPVDPSAEHAREWVVAELRKSIYHPQPSLADRLRQWLSQLLDEGFLGSAPSAFKFVAVVVLAALVLAVLYGLSRVGPGGRGAAAARPGSAVFDETGLSAADYRNRATAHERDGRYDHALLDWFRALVRGSEERDVVDATQGRTAHELIQALAHAFPEYQGVLPEHGRAFDAVRYGSAKVTPAQAAAMRDLEAHIARSAPHYAEPAAGPTSIAPGGGVW